VKIGPSASVFSEDEDHRRDVDGRKGDEMASWMHETRCHGTPQDVLALLTEAEAIARWSPVPFELVDSASGRLRAGDRVRVRGALGGRSVEFVVQVGDAREGCAGGACEASPRSSAKGSP
jgi:hypothetical protein